MADLPGWPYWKVISVTGQSGAGTDYQVELEIGDSAGGDFHLEGHCTNFPQDIRITDDDGTTLLDHFIEDITADPIVVHVEVKDDLGSNQAIRVYYGKSGETTASNISTTMIFGDDFTDDLSKWSQISGTWTISDNLLKTPTGGSGFVNLRSLSGIGIGNNYVLESRQRGQTGSFSNGSIVHHADSIDYVYNGYTQYSRVGGYTYFYVDGSGDYNSGSFPVMTWFRYKAIIDELNTNYAYVYSDAGSLLSTLSTTTDAAGTNYYVGVVSNRGNPDDADFDWIFVRKYNSPEPAFSSAGAEQTPTGVSPTSVFYGPLVGPFGGPI